MPPQSGDARRRVRDRLGSAFADKATDALCEALGRPRAAVEAFGVSRRSSPVVVEFTPPPQPETRGELRDAPAWRDLRKAAEALRAAAPPEAALVQGQQLLRDARVRAAREAFYRRVGPVSDRLARAAGEGARRREFAAREAGVPRAPLEVCWLNGTARVRTDPRVLAEVAEDGSVRRLDLPRRLRAEVAGTTARIGAPRYRGAKDLTGAGVVVAVIDSEVDLSHPAFQDRVVHKENLTAEPWGRPGEHGTAVAGVVAADNEFQGVAPGAVIYNYKVLATNESLTTDDFGGALALQQALEDGARVANCSWGVPEAPTDGTSREAAACDAAWGYGMAVVKSAGNAGPTAGTVTSPADAAGVIAVGATSLDGTRLEGYSSRGPTLHGEDRPHLLAPGGNRVQALVSCVVGGGYGPGSGIGFYGTSFAAPHVSGALALLLEEDPERTPDDLRTLLLGACVQLPGVEASGQGAGLLDLAFLP